MHINDLPDDCLLKIFSGLSLSSKLTLHRVCPRWRSLQYSVTCTHTSLTLLIGSGSNSRVLLNNSCLKIPYLHQIEPNNSTHFRECTTILELSNLSSNVTCQLMQLLPNVTALELCLNHCEMSSMDYTLKLLKFWSSKVKFLCLFYDHNSCDNTRSTQHLKGVLSHLRLLNGHCLALDCLSIEVRDDFQTIQKNFRRRRKRSKEKHSIDSKPLIDLQCLALLKEFRFYSHDPIDVLFESFKLYLPESVRLEKIAIGNYITIDDRNKVDHLFRGVPKIMSKLILVPDIKSLKFRLNEYSKITSLTSLSINMDSYTWTQITTFLSPLKNIIHLKLGIGCDDVLSEYDSTPSYELVPLPSIRIMQISLVAQTHTELQSRHWGHIFPSLQLLELKLFGLGEAPIHVAVKSGRLHLLLEPFKWQCAATLRRIVLLGKHERHSEERKVWQIGEDNSWNEIGTD